MPVAVVGLNHRTAPLDVLERLAVPARLLPVALRRLTAREHIDEAVIVSTCNRVELYAAVSGFHGGMMDLRHFLAELHGLEAESFAGHLYDWHEDRAVRHLFEVASGLDSMVVGEAQILGQVRSALRAGEVAGSTGPLLSALFRQAINVGRRARAETSIGAGPRSILAVALRLVEERLGPLADRRVVVVGAGEMGRLAGRTLRAAGVTDAVVANRTLRSALALAGQLAGRAVSLDGLEEALTEADLLVAATGSVQPTVAGAMVASAMAGRADRPLLIVDLGVPRDVDPSARSVPGVTVSDIDSLRSAVAEDAGGGPDAIVAARAIVEAETEAFLSRLRQARLGPTIAAMRARAELLRVAELERMAPRLAGLGDKERAAVEALTRGLVNKLLHDPMVRSKALAGGPDGEAFARILGQLYAVEGEPPAAQADVS